MPLDLEAYAKEGAELRVRFFKENKQAVIDAAQQIISCLKAGGKLLIFGNGGSAADAQHVAAELVNRFKVNRQALAALALTTDTSTITSIANDFDYTQVFARQVRALGKMGDVVLAISTSGNSPNVLEGIKAAEEEGIYSFGLTGGDGGKMAKACDAVLHVDSANVALVQEVHLAVEHVLCDLVEQAFLCKT